jgi:hypothetical protein
MASDALTLASHFLYGAICSTCDRFKVGWVSSEWQRASENERASYMRQDDFSESFGHPLPLVLSALSDILQVFFEGDGDRYQLLDVGKEVSRFKGRNDCRLALFRECPQRLRIVLQRRKSSISLPATEHW